MTRTNAVTRRTVLATIGAAGLGSVAGCIGAPATGSEPDGSSEETTTPNDPDNQALPTTGTPPVIDLNEQGLTSTLRTRSARHELVTESAAGGPVELPEVWAWEADDHDPSVPGPTYLVPEGEAFSLEYENTHDRPHTVHMHAVDRSWGDDGAPSGGAEHLAPGDSHVYEYVADVPGTHFYHCHVQTDSHLDMGMYGVLHVVPADIEPADREYFLTLRDWDSRLHQMHATGDVEYDPRDRSSDTYTINGRAAPTTFHPELGSPLIAASGETVRVHLINAGYESHPFHTHAHRFDVVARDGSRIPPEQRQAQDVISVAPAQRITIEFTADADPGIYPAHCHKAHHVTIEGSYPGGMATAIVYEEAMETDEFAEVMADAGFEA